MSYKPVSSVENPFASEREIYYAICDHQEKHREAELASGQCLTGAHKDDLELMINGKSARSFASQGQARTAALSVKLAEREIFLAETGEYPVLLLDDETDAVVGTGSLCGSVLKYIAVSEAMQGEGGAASIVSELVRHAYTCGRRKLFLFTKPQNEYLFRSLGFFRLAATDGAIYMENSRSGLKNYLDSLEKGRGVQGAIVANCNPFTLGHKYLMETAAAQVDSLHVFILSENSAENAEFSAEARFELVKKGTKHIKNLLLHRSGDYIISHSTFPTYFIKDKADAGRINADLDLTLFGSAIAPALGITKRFVGTEPFCAVTRAYNERMKQILPKYGVEVIEIPRIGGISASLVRKAMAEGNLELVSKIVPETTMEYIRAENQEPEIRSHRKS